MLEQAREVAIDPDPRARARAPRLGYRPGLDGLRAIAVLAVFGFHGGIGVAVGGYLAVSTFFTLSGFLITILLLDEQAASARVALGAFWERRIRRLLPAAALGVVLAALVTALVGTDGQRSSFAGDGIATVLDVANWRFVLVERSYARLFEAPSTLQHAWSLAIEAQFYWLYPLLFIVVMRVVGGERRRFGAVLLVLFAASLALTRFSGFDFDRIYYGTDTRAAELLAGAILAVLVSGRRSRRWIDRPPTRGIDAATALGLGALVVAWVVVPSGVSWATAGGLGVYAAVSAVAVLGAAIPGSLVARGLGVAPLRALGRISYGFYLFHWPILVLLAPGRFGLAEPVRLAVAFGLTVGAAALSYRCVELPIRTRSSPFRRVGVTGLGVGCIALAVLASVAVPRGDAGTSTLDIAAGSLLSDVGGLGRPPGSAVEAPTGAPPAAVPGELPGPASGPATGLPHEPLVPAPFDVPSRPLRVVIVGDSYAWELGELLGDWGAPIGVWEVARHARIGCGILRGGDGRSAFGEAAFGPECSVWPEEWADMVEQVAPDLIVLAGGFWDATDRRMPGDEEWRAPGDPVQDARIAADYQVALDVLTAAGTPVVWLDHPPVWFNEDTVHAVVNPQIFEPSRMERLDAIQAEVTAGRPGVRIVATRPYLDAWPGGVFDPALRPDGLHVKGPGARPLIDWLGPEVLNAYWSMAAPPG